MTIITKGMGAIFKGGAKKTTTTSVSGNQLLNKLSEIKNRPALKETFTPKVKPKSEYRLKNQLKNIQKMPDKKFKHQNPETVKVKSDRTGRVSEVRKKDPVKGSLGKKTYKQDFIKGQRAHKRMGFIKD